MYFMDILLFPVYKPYMCSYCYISCLHHNILVEFVSEHRGHMAVYNDTQIKKYTKLRN